jgi:hypothetical protein
VLLALPKAVILFICKYPFYKLYENSYTVYIINLFWGVVNGIFDFAEIPSRFLEKSAPYWGRSREKEGFFKKIWVKLEKNQKRS